MYLPTTYLGRYVHLTSKSEATGCVTCVSNRPGSTRGPLEDPQLLGHSRGAIRGPLRWSAASSRQLLSTDSLHVTYTTCHPPSAVASSPLTQQRHPYWSSAILRGRFCLSPPRTNIRTPTKTFHRAILLPSEWQTDPPPLRAKTPRRTSR